MTPKDDNPNKIRKLLADIPEIEYAAVFGSLAKERLTAEGDIDTAIADKTPFTVEFNSQVIQILNDQSSHCKVQIEPWKEVLDERLVEGIESGKAQKFEILIELCWKTFKHFLKTIEGIDAKTPTQSVKEFYLAKYLKEDEYLQLLKAIDDRDELSHVHKEEVFKEIVGRYEIEGSVNV